MISLRDVSLPEAGAVLKELIARVASAPLDLVCYRNTRWEFVERGHPKMIEDMIEAAQLVGVIRLIAEYRGLPVMHVPVSKREVGGGGETLILQHMARKAPLLLRYPGDDDLEVPGKPAAKAPVERPRCTFLKVGTYGQLYTVEEEPQENWEYHGHTNARDSYYLVPTDDLVGGFTTVKRFLNGDIEGSNGQRITLEQQKANHRS